MVEWRWDLKEDPHGSDKESKKENRANKEGSENGSRKS